MIQEQQHQQQKQEQEAAWYSEDFQARSQYAVMGPPVWQQFHSYSYDAPQAFQHAAAATQERVQAMPLRLPPRRQPNHYGEVDALEHMAGPY